MRALPSLFCAAAVSSARCGALADDADSALLAGRLALSASASLGAPSRRACKATLCLASSFRASFTGARSPARARDAALAI
ncbi:hypothetical protein [Chromobacterium phragmitis]|uniref:hypothetical protein n=1 Tax=Chromobacterium phragmitis TaxID=2202141 RepID=UPI0038779FCF